MNGKKSENITVGGAFGQMRRERVIGVALFILVIVGYGIPLTRGYFTAREAEHSPEKMEELLVKALDAEPGSVPSRAWMGRIVMLLPPERAREILLERARFDPRQGVRYVALDLLARYYREDLAMYQAEADQFLNDPTRNVLYRNLLLLAHPWLDPDGTAQRLIDEQVQLFPHPEATVLRPLVSDPQLR